MQTTPTFIHQAGGTGKTYSAVGDNYTLLASGEQTGGAYTLFEAKVWPGGGPPPHLHTREEECFFILEGEITFMVDGRSVVAGPGSFVQIPRRTPHAFKNQSGAVARMLVQCVPAGFDRFMQEIGHELPSADSPPAPVTPADVEKLLATVSRYGMEILPPPAA